jgi:Tol biopolymer transport system component
MTNAFKAGVTLIFLFLLGSCSHQTEKANFTEQITDWKYFGLQSPGNIPQVFSPDIISTHRNERDFTTSLSGHEMFYSLVSPGNNISVILFLHWDGFFWSEPEVAPFSGRYKDMEPFYSPDGNKFFFISNRPLKNGDSKPDYDIWYVDISSGNWALAMNAGDPVNTEGNEYYPTVAANGNLYFTASREDSPGQEDIYFSKYSNGKYSSPVNLGDSINTSFPEFNAFISPDENYLLFSSIGREGELGGGDIYISLRKNDGTWEKPKNLGKGINSDELDFCPFVTRDGKYLFFTSHRTNPNLKIDSKKNYSNLKFLIDGIHNGNGNIYWVEFNPDKWK